MDDRIRIGVERALLAYLRERRVPDAEAKVAEKIDDAVAFFVSKLKDGTIGEMHRSQQLAFRELKTWSQSL